LRFKCNLTSATERGRKTTTTILESANLTGQFLFGFFT